LTLKNGFTIDGKSACVSKENFNQEIGNKIARDNAREKIWELEGYLLKEKLDHHKNNIKVAVDGLLDTRIPILNQIYDVCQAIEKCGASPELTDAIRLAGELRDPISELVRQAIDLGIGHGIVSVSHSSLNFGDALIALKQGKKVARSGWNGKNQYVVAQAKTTTTEAAKIWNTHNKAHAEKLGGQIDVAPYCTLKTAQDTLAMGWTPSTGDLFANDWVIIS
jgi:hypothetical protein